jgi:hypothetical protein
MLKINFTKQDVCTAADAWTHFNVPMSRRLKRSFNRILRQKGRMEHRAKVLLAAAVVFEIATSRHPFFTDPFFKDIREDCKRLARKNKEEL